MAVVLALIALHAGGIRAEAATSMFVGGGPGVVQNSKWGGGAAVGVEIGTRSPLCWVVRADLQDLPRVSRLNAIHIGWTPPPDNRRARLWSAMVGVRLHRMEPGFRGYADLLAGSVHVDPDDGTEYPRAGTGIGYAVGFGLQFVGSRGGVFADLHFQGSSVRGVGTPFVPLRIGLLMP